MRALCECNIFIAMCNLIFSLHVFGYLHMYNIQVFYCFYSLINICNRKSFPDPCEMLIIKTVMRAFIRHNRAESLFLHVILRGNLLYNQT